MLCRLLSLHHLSAFSGMAVNSRAVHPEQQFPYTVDIAVRHLQLQLCFAGVRHIAVNMAAHRIKRHTRRHHIGRYCHACVKFRSGREIKLVRRQMGVHGMGTV